MMRSSPVDDVRPAPQEFPGGIEIPTWTAAALPFARLDAGLPLLLLPVRIETRYHLEADPPELRIRVFPDQASIDADTPEPGAVEAELTRQFWRDRQAASDEAGRQAAWRTLVRRVGSRRAGYLARLLRPTVGPRGVLMFPDNSTDTGEAMARVPARPVLLPHQWVAAGYSETARLFLEGGAEIAPGLRTAPDPAAPPWQVASSGVTVDEGLAWMFDYDRAVEVGMAVTVPLTGAAEPARTGVKTLLVVGVDADTDPVDTAAELDRLLGVHARTDGLAFVPQGTPTNNTASATAGWVRDDTTVPDDDAEQDPVAEDIAPVEGDNAARLASALGLPGSDTLRRSAYGTDPERGRSRAMVRATFEALFGTFARDLLAVRGAEAVSAETLAGMREWCVQYVTGGAPLPTLRIGAQPYGVLPVLLGFSETAVDATAVQRRVDGPLDLPGTDIPDGVPTVGPAVADQLRSVVSLLIGEWRRSVLTVPHLDPNRTDVSGEGVQETDIATILATSPHPARLFLRHLQEFNDYVDEHGGLGETPQGWYDEGIVQPNRQAQAADFAPPYYEIFALYRSALDDDPPQTIDDQIRLWQGVGDDFPGMLRDIGWGLEAAEQDRLITEVGQPFVQSVLELLASYEQRQRPVRWLELLAYEGVLSEPNTALVEGVLAQASTEWGAFGLVQAPDALPGETASDYLADLRSRLDAPGAGLGPSGLSDGFLARKPLLYQLLVRTLDHVPAEVQAEVGAALGQLAVRDPEELEWLFRETMGLATHRLDAWATSLASERLGRLRALRPAGIAVGGFGWVTGLAPREGPRRSGGFVHAPSMAQATTAAVLRAGWQAHGTDDPLSPTAVDFSSARVRTASWLLDGVREGQDLGDLLGYRFERSLHDLHADVEIRGMRAKVLTATGRPDVAPDEPVDGIDLLDLHRTGDLGPLSDAASTAIADLEEAFDAVNNVGLVESVHQLVTGNFDRATAMLDAMSTGTRTPPELRAPLTTRSGTSVEHRVVVLLDPAASPPGRGWVAGVRDSVAPALEAWVASLLPPANTVGFSVSPVPGPSGVSDTAPAPTRLTLRDLGLSALDALWLVGDDAAKVPGPLLTLAAGRLGSDGPVRVDPAESGAAPVSLSEFSVLAVELRRGLDRLRPADARDLRPAATAGEPDAEDTGVLDAAEAVITQYASLVDRLGAALQAGSGADVADLAGQLARRGVSVGAPPGDLVAAGDLLAVATRRGRSVATAGGDLAERRPRVEAQLAALLRGRIPLLPSFTLSAAPDGAVVDFAADLAGPAEVDDWLDAVARVRPDLARLATAGLLSELLTPDGGLRGRAGQSPRPPGEAWAATGRPPRGTGGRLSVVALTDPSGPPAPGSAACGLVVDRWSERIPHDEQMTGVALQFDAPSNRPPQSWLLALPPDGETWSLGLVLDTLLETLDWTRLRAVAPEDLTDYGRALPTVAVPGMVHPWPEKA